MARYIDADKLIAHLKDEIKECEIPFGSRANGKGISYGTAIGLKSAISFAETLPTANVVPKSELEISQHLLKDAWKRIEELDELCGELQRKYDLAVAEREANVKGFTEELEKANAEVESIITLNSQLEAKVFEERKEVERLKHILDCYALQYGTVIEQQEVIDKAKAEFAREIFAEIDSKILAEIDLCNGVLIEFEEADELYHRIKGEVSALCKMQDFIAELKKKYTEQCPDCKHFVGCEEAVWSGRCEDFDSVRKEDEIYEKGYNDALKDVEEMITKNISERGK